jgi:hypothetical protein
MQEYDTEISITLSTKEVTELYKQMLARPKDFVKLTAKLYFLESEQPETRLEVFLYGEGPDEKFELDYE